MTGMWRDLLSGVVGAIAPRVCMVCGGTLGHGERHFCLTCSVQMPRTGRFSLAGQRIADRLSRLQPDTPVAAWFFYRRSTPWAHVIHAAKYGGRPRLARDLGQMMATEMAGSAFWNDVDCIIAMPMHFTKRLLRGYNQAVEIARGVSSVTHIPLCRAVYARRPHGTQTRRSALGRSQNVRPDMFDVRHPELLSDKTVVIVDDVVTTGATIEALTTLLHKKCGIRMAKILCLGLTEND